LIGAILACCGLISAAPGDASPPSSSDRAAYEAARDKAGRDADANVRLALWCEARGLEAEKLRHLALAVLVDPGHAGARGLLGLVSEGGRWGSPEAVAARLEADSALKAKRLEYDARRARTPSRADDHAKLAAWCEDQGLKAEAQAHYTNVTRLDPSRDSAWRKLGCKKFEDRWLRPDQIEVIKAEREAQGRANKHWFPHLDKLKVDLAKTTRRDEAIAALDALSEPRAVPAIRKVFAQGDARDQFLAVRLLGQVDSHDASKALAVLAVSGIDDNIRRSAIETLRRRDLRGVLAPIIELLHEPIKYTFKLSEGPGSRGVLLMEGEKVNVARTYDAPIAMATTARIRGGGDVTQRTATANAPLLRDVQIVEAQNQATHNTNARAQAVLKGLTGRDLGTGRDAWLAWWTDRQGYAFKSGSTKAAFKPTIFENISTPTNAYDCFGAGTPVQTIDGPRPIETIKMGDRVLTQDTATGLLSYQPTVAIYHGPPAETLRVGLGGEGIVVIGIIGIHRFWKAGQGWTMARDLKVGDPIRHLGGVARVESIGPDRAQPVFNLEVARNADFFVGKLAALVHDNSIVRPVAQPFDVPAELTAAKKDRRQD